MYPCQRIFLTTIIFLMAVAGRECLFARTWYVDIYGTGDMPTIQAAIDTAGIGDEIIVGPGYYTWSNQGTGDHRGFIRFYTRDHNLILRSEMGPEVTTLDAEYQSRVIYCHGMNNITVEGFTITHGEAPEWGDYCGGGFSTHIPADCLRNCVFINNRGEYGGAVACCINDGFFHIENCTFTNNESAKYGGALGLSNGTGTITVTGCVIQNNSATLKGGAIFQYNCPSIIEDCVITDNYADVGGSCVSAEINASIAITGCTVCRNTSNGAVVSILHNTTISLNRNIIAFNTDPAFGTNATITGIIGCCDIHGNSGGDSIPEGFIDTGHNIFLDPLFCGIPGSGNYYLRSDSPCLPPNHPDGLGCNLIGAYTTGCGAVHTKKTSWGGIKAMYK